MNRAINIFSSVQVVATCLRESGVEAVEVKGSIHKRIEAIDRMQEKGGPRVALLNLADESAAGANLQVFLLQRLQVI